MSTYAAILLLKLLVFLYTINEKINKEIKKIILFTVASKGIKFLGINLTSEAKDVCPENYTVMLEEMKGDVP